MNSQQTHDILATWYGSMGRFDWGTVMGMLDDDVVFNLSPKSYTSMIPYLGRWVGKDAFMQASQIRNETSKITGFEIKGIVAEGNEGVARVISKATGIATGKYFELDIIQWVTVSDSGKIVAVDAIFDPVPEMDAFQPGVVPNVP